MSHWQENADMAKAINKRKRKRVHQEHPADPRDSSVVGHTKRWVRQRLLGKGEFGMVFLARPAKPSTKLPPFMAVKSAIFSKSDELAMEYRLLKKFRECPFVLNTYGSDVTQDIRGEKWFNVMLECAERGSIGDWIRGNGMNEQHVRRFTQSSLKGLDFIHNEGYVHCDIKPANLFLKCKGPCDAGFDSFEAKIGDFGLAKKATTAKDSEMKRSSSVQGSPLYYSPEVTHYGIQEPPSDIWALGCSVLQMLTGQEFWDVNTDTVDESGRAIEVPVIPEWLRQEAKDFLNKCFVINHMERYTAQMLLKHPFVCTSLPMRKVPFSRESTTMVPSRVLGQEQPAFPLLFAV